MIFGQLDKLIIESECDIVLESAQLFLVSDSSGLSLSCLHWILSSLVTGDNSLISDPKLRLYVAAVALELLGTNLEGAAIPSSMFPVLSCADTI